MNTRSLTLALVIGFFSMMLVYTYLEDKEAELRKNYGSEAPVLIAQKDIKELELIDDSKVTVINRPSKLIHTAAFKAVRDIENTVATVPILKGEVITRPRVTYPGVKTGLSRQISIGMRAIAIPITEYGAVSKLIKPGDRVDVLAKVDYSSGRKDLVKMQTILQDVTILSTGFSMTNSIPIVGVKTPREIKKLNLNTYGKFNSVTLELTPVQVQKILFVRANISADLTLSLRNNGDRKRLNIPSTDILGVLPKGEENDAKRFFAEKYEKKGKR